MLGKIFTYLLVAFGVGTGWFNPVAGLMSFYVFSVLRPQHTWWYSFGGDFGRYNMMVGVSLVIGWVLRGTGNWSAIKHVWLPVLGLFIFIASGYFSTSISSIPSLRGDQILDQLSKIFLVVIITLTLLNKPNHLKALAWTITLSLSYLALNLNQQYFDHQLVGDGWSWGGVDNNGVAMVMVSAVPLVFFMGLNVKSLLMKGVCFASAVLLVHVVLFSYSRGGQLGLIIVGAGIFVTCIITLPRKLLTFSLTLVMVGITLFLAGENVRKEFASIFVGSDHLDGSAASRFDTWNAGWQIMKSHPLGVGPDRSGAYVVQFGLKSGKRIHNLFLQMGADFGFIGLFGLLMFYFGTIFQSYKMARSRMAKKLVWPVYYGTMICISLGGMMICSLFIGMESVEIGYVTATLGLITVSYIKQLQIAEPHYGDDIIPELAQVRQP